MDSSQAGKPACGLRLITQDNIMRQPSKALLSGMALAACTLAQADEFGRHPYYLHALSDLRAAQWQIDHRRPEDGEIQEDEMVLADETAMAIQTVKAAAMDDGKNMAYQPPVDADLDRPGRLHAADDLLKKARQDIAQPEDDPVARGRQRVALLHIDAALHAADRAFKAVHRIEQERE